MEVKLIEKNENLRNIREDLLKLSDKALRNISIGICTIIGFTGGLSIKEAVSNIARQSTAERKIRNNLNLSFIFQAFSISTPIIFILLTDKKKNEIERKGIYYLSHALTTISSKNLGKMCHGVFEAIGRQPDVEKEIRNLMVSTYLYYYPSLFFSNYLIYSSNNHAKNLGYSLSILPLTTIFDAFDGAAIGIARVPHTNETIKGTLLNSILIQELFSFSSCAIIYYL